MATTPVPDLVRLSKLDTHFHSDPEYILHVEYVAESNTRQRKVRKEEKWKRERRLGRGGFGTVWSEKCIQGDRKGELRAVKEIPKHESYDYYRELEAVALFSHTKVILALILVNSLFFTNYADLIQYEQSFVKSFGWYDNSDDIFITMEYLPYGDLQKYLGSPLPESESQHIVHQILEGLYFMHDHDFAHRDLKPNVSLPLDLFLVSKVCYSCTNNVERSSCPRRPRLVGQDCGLWNQQASNRRTYSTPDDDRHTCFYGTRSISLFPNG